MFLLIVLFVALAGGANASGNYTCGVLTGCFIRNLDFPEEGDIPLLPSEPTVYSVGKRDSFSIRCDVEGSINKMEFTFDGQTKTEYSAPLWMRGDSPGWINRVDYLLQCPERKQVQVVGFIWQIHEPCFDVTFELFAECDDYQITLDLIGVEDTTLFTDATSRWETVITGDLPAIVNYPDFAFPFGDCSLPLDVDDLNICGLFQEIDGPFNILAMAGPRFIRVPGFLPIDGVMMFDSDDVGTTIAGDSLRDVILHEMGHVLGLGTIWELLGVAGPDAEDCPYLGSRATEEFARISGCDTAPPLELIAGPGSRCGHWAEFCFDTELMTPFADIDSFQPLSQITAASLEDLGYEVSFDHIDHISSSDLSPDCLCHRRLTATRQISRDRPQRKLQSDTEAMAVAAGIDFLGKQKGGSDMPNGVKFVGDKVVVVYVLEDGAVYDVIVAV